MPLTALPSGNRRQLPNARRALTAALIAQSTVAVIDQGVPTLAGFAAEDLALSTAVAGVLVGAFPAGKAIGYYAAGAAVDRLGERIVMGVGAVICGTTVVLAALLPFAGLCALLVAAGLFAATTAPAGGKLVLTAFPRRRRGLVMGIRQAGMPVGGLAAALLLPWLSVQWGWHTALVAAGAVALGGGLAALLVAGWETAAERAQAAARHRRPRPRLRRDFALICGWGCLLVGGGTIVIAFLPLYVSDVAAISLPTAAVVLLVLVQAGAIAGRLGWGVISDRLFGGRRKPVLVACALASAGVFALLAVVPDDSPPALFGALAFAGGTAAMGWQAMFLTGVTEAVGPARAGEAAGLALTFVAAAVAVSPPVYGLVADHAGGFRTMWAAAGAVALVAAVPALAVGEDRDKA